MPPQGCDLAVPGDKLYSSATRKTYRVWPGCATFFFKSKFGYKKNNAYGNFPPSCVVLMFTKQNSSKDC